MAIPDISNSRWCEMHIEPCWQSHQDLKYINETFNDDASVELWRNLGYTQQRFTGDMYDMRNPAPDWMCQIYAHLPWKHFAWTLYRMSPGRVLPRHQDIYAKFLKIHDISDPTLIYRAVIFLEDWQSGHYFEIDENPIVEWRAGDGIIWNFDVPHLSANIGMTNRYTLQITGIPHANPLIQ